MKNYIQDGDFRSVSAGSFDVTANAAVGSFFASAGVATISAVTRGTFAASIAAISGAGSAIPVDLSLQKYFQFSVSSPVALALGNFYALISSTITNGNRIFSGNRARFSFWINSTSRYVGIRMHRNFGSGSTTGEKTTDVLLSVSPNVWQKVNYDFNVPAFASSDDLEAADFLKFDIVLDNVTTASVFSSPVRFVETSVSGTPTVKITGVSCELLSNSPANDTFDPAPITDVSQLTDKKTLLGGGSVTTGNLTEAVSSILTIGNGTGAVVGSGTTIQVKQASGSQAGFLAAADWTTFNGKQSLLTLGNLTEATSSVLVLTGGTGAVVGSGLSIQVKQASGSQAGYLAAADWTTFNGKQNSLTLGNLTEATSSVLTITGGTGSVIGSGLSVQVKQASGSQAGYLSSTDWTTFNTRSVKLLSIAGGGNGDTDYVGKVAQKEGQLGIAYYGTKNPFLYFAGSTTSGDWLYSFIFPTGIKQIGSPSEMDANNYQNLYLEFAGNTTGYSASGDFGPILRNRSTNLAATTAYSIAVMGGTSGQATVISDVGVQFAHSPSHRNANLMPGWAMNVCNPDSTNVKGFSISGPGNGGGWGPGSGDTGNFSGIMVDYVNGLFRIPKFVVGAYQPTDAGWTDTATFNLTTQAVAFQGVVTINQPNGKLAFPATGTAMHSYTNEIDFCDSGYTVDWIGFNSTLGIKLQVAGMGIQIKEGSNARMGTATLVGGTVTVSNTSVSANTRIFYSRQTSGGTIGEMSSSKINGTSFTLTSLNALDTSTFAWELKEGL